MNDLSRREFLSTTAAVTAAGLMSAIHVAPAAAAEKEPVRMAFMGVNGRGRGLISGFSNFPEVEFAYVCDCDSKVVAPAVKQITDKGKKEPKVVTDFRKALDDRDVDVLVVAAPDHWHSLATIWACQSGKDVYVEKPVSHNVVEGWRVVEAARHYKKVVGTGSQRRSATCLQQAVKAIQDGKIGKVHFARCWITSTRPNIGHEDPVDPPENLDFDLWAGPGPAKYYKKNLVHYHWHWRWDYGTGECGNNGIHGLDVARWGLGVEAPKYVACGGAKYHFDDDQETPDTQLATFDFDECCIQWEHRTWSKRGIDGSEFGIVFYGDEGTIASPGAGWTMYDKNNKEVQKVEKSAYELPHLQNFLDCLVSREHPNADVEIGAASAQLCHLANIAWRTRSTLKVNPEAMGDQASFLVGNPDATKLLAREYRKGYELPKIE